MAQVFPVFPAHEGGQSP